MFISNNNHLFKDYNQIFDLCYLIDLTYRDIFAKHKEIRNYSSIPYTFFKSVTRNLMRFNKMYGFDLVFDSIKDNKAFNSYSELTYAYKLKDEIVSELLKYETDSNKIFKRGKLQISKGYKVNNRVYRTKKDIIKGEDITMYDINKNIKEYAYEIKDLAKGDPITQSFYPNESYKHNFRVNLKVAEEYVELFKQGNYGLISQPDLISLNHMKNNYKKGLTTLSYERKVGGRLVNYGGKTSSCLQSLEKKVRNKLFEGFYEIDIENSAPSILLQSAYKYTKLKLPRIEYYIDNKKECRNKIQELGFTEKEAKELLLAIFFGASLTINGVENRNSWASKIGADRIEYVLENYPFFYALYEEVRLLFSYLGKAIKNKFYIKDKKGNKILYNSRGNHSGKPMNRWDNKKAIMHYYFGIESQILDLITKNYSHDLLLYDAFITKEDVNLDELSQMVEQELGYNIKFSKRLIKG